MKERSNSDQRQQEKEVSDEWRDSSSIDAHRREEHNGLEWSWKAPLGRGYQAGFAAQACSYG